MKKINHYVILGCKNCSRRKNCSNSLYFVDGYKSLATLKKRFNLMQHTLESVPHDSIILCPRDENKNILKIYDKFE